MSLGTKRRDHYIPQGYLRGFIDPARFAARHPQPLCHFDVPTKKWSERSPSEVGYRIGFYDYATASIGLEQADELFGEFENGFPKIRRELVSTNFAQWTTYRDFLLRYMQMMRSRSRLFFDDHHELGQTLRAWEIEEIHPDRKTVKVRSAKPEPLSKELIQNYTIAEMSAEIKKGASWLNDFQWALRYCESPANPFVISENPLCASGNAVCLEDAFEDPEMLLFFPFCWQACLIGSRQFFEVETDRFNEEELLRLREIYRESASLFIISPAKLDFA